MKKAIFASIAAALISLSGAASAVACDFCLLSQGISPLETISGAGVRANERFTSLDKVYNGTHELSNPGAKEEFWTTEVTGFYALNEDLMVMGVVPVKRSRMKGELMVNPDNSFDLDPMSGTASGLGDIALMARYSLLKSHTLDTTTVIAGVVGVKLPTGATDKRADNGEYLDSHIQPGTGSTDFILGASCSRAMGRLSASANILGTITTEGKFGETKHRFGNMLNYDATARYRLTSSGAAGAGLFAALGVNGELRAKEKVDGVTDPNSGGHTVYISPGVQVQVGPHWTVELSYQKAVYHDLNGVQLAEDFKTVGGVTYQF